MTPPCAVSVGIDLVDVNRFKRSIDLGGDPLRHAIFGDGELLLWGDSPDSLAAVFALKEAVMKAMGAGITEIDWLEIQLRSLDGPPSFHGDAARVASSRRIVDWAFDVESSGGHVIAVALATEQEVGRVLEGRADA
jgi:holo-[acyl-carrier protein] synthase